MELHTMNGRTTSHCPKGGLPWTWALAGATVLALLLTAAVAARAAEPSLVDLAAVDDTIEQEPRYAGSNNFLGRPVRGYGTAKVMLTREAAVALSRAQEAAVARGLSLRVYDGYRPQRAVDHFVEWAADPDDTVARAAYYPDVPKDELFERGYIARRSGHSRGSTVDLTLTRDGEPLPMGTDFDFFGELSHTEHPAITGEARENRLLLRRIMAAAGFRNYVKEWWHYTLIDEPYPDRYFDMPVE